MHAFAAARGPACCSRDFGEHAAQFPDHALAFRWTLLPVTRPDTPLEAANSQRVEFGQPVQSAERRAVPEVCGAGTALQWSVTQVDAVRHAYAFPHSNWNRGSGADRRREYVSFGSGSGPPRAGFLGLHTAIKRAPRIFTGAGVSSLKERRRVTRRPRPAP